MFVADYPLSKLHAAAYNPREIDEASQEALRTSLKLFGVVKPLIVRDTGTIIAGHQRFEQMRALGLKTAPVYIVKGITLTDEIRFNQLHNMTDDAPEIWARVPPGKMTGSFEDVPQEAVTGSFRGPSAYTRSIIGELICRYGPWGAAVATEDGTVIHGVNYTLTCAVMGIPCRIFRVPDTARAWLSREYGSYTFAALAGETWRQSSCQRPRLRSGGKRMCYSSLYETHVLPALERTERLLDFGAGYADYARKLAGLGFKASWIEFFPGTQLNQASIDQSTAAEWCRNALAELTNGGPFDVVVCDSVLNSVDSKRAEQDVMTVLSAMCRPGGRVHFSGRRKEDLMQTERSTCKRDLKPRIGTCATDKNGIVATYRGDMDGAESAWTFQKFHSADEAKALAESYIGPVERFTHTTTSWQITARKTRIIPDTEIKAALAREFDLPLPDGKRFGYAAEAVAAWQNAWAIPPLRA